MRYTIRVNATMGDAAPPVRRFKKIAVFCGASSGSNPVYIQAAQQLGEEMAARGIGLVYGVGGSGGPSYAAPPTVALSGGG
jgi:predicted Rossmann-fold nucleotide-binding protein